MAARAQVQLVPVINTVAGNGSGGYSGDNGPATGAQLNGPYGVAVDSSGNLYIPDITNNRIREVNTLGIITTVAGDGTQGFSGDNGPATSAELSNPCGVAVDAFGNLYISDQGNNRIREVNPSGIITTVAGNGTQGFSGDNGPATSAEMFDPIGLAVDAFGDLYIADYLNNRIRMVSPGGIITTVAGDGTGGFSGDNGPATGAELYEPTGVAVDASGKLYIADWFNNRIRMVDLSGIITTVAGNGGYGYSGDNGPATSAELYAPFGVALDASGNLYISAQYNYRIREVNTLGIISTVAGDGTSAFSGDNGPATSAELVLSSGVAMDTSGNLYIADVANDRIRKVSEVNPSLNGTITNFPTTAVGTSAAVQNVLIETTATETITSISAPVSQGGFQEFSVGAITGCAIGASSPSGTICIVPITFTPAYPGFRQIPLQVVTSAGNVSFGLQGVATGPQVALTPGIISTVAGDGGNGFYGDNGLATSAQLTTPVGVALDASGDLYIADVANYRIRMVSPSGIITTVAGNGVSGYSGDNGPATSAELADPYGLALDASGNLYIADHLENRIRMVSPSGIITTVAGNGTYGFSGDNGVATSAELGEPVGVAVDASGDIYIADFENNRIRKVSPSGIITTVAGDGTQGYSGDNGPATSAELVVPTGVALDASGNLYIAEPYDSRVRKVSPSGIITTVAGNGTQGYSGDNGPATSAEFQGPSSVALDASGNLYITDQFNNRIRVVSPSGIITTAAGNGTSGFSDDNGPATGAELANPYSVALDASGNLYIADVGNYRIRKVNIGITAALNFANTVVGSQSADSPQSFQVGNIGNAPLTILVPSAGSNPSVAPGFSFDASSTCPEMTANSSPYSLAPGASCTYALDFIPIVVGSDSGSLVLSDNSLNNNATQTISLSGAGDGVGTTTTLMSSLNPSSYGQILAITANVIPASGAIAPSGAVQFSVDGVTVGLPATLNGGTAAFTPSALAVGSHNITAGFSPGTGSPFTASSSLALSQVVNKAVPTVSFTGAPGSAQYESTFAVAATTNASTTAVTTASGSCTIAGANVVITAPSGTCLLTATWAADNNYLATSAAQSTTATKATPVITWAAPAAITYGTALGGTQLDATTTYKGATVAGTFVYTPAKGTVLTAGTQTLSVAFTPNNTVDFTNAGTSVTLQVIQASPKVTWAKPAAITYGTALSGTQLDASASVSGTLVYSPAAGTILTAGSQSLSVSFTPTDVVDYTTATDSVTITVGQAKPTVTWATPATVAYGTALSSTQLDATGSVPGTFVYSPAAGAVPAGGTQTLSVTFTPADTTDYTTAKASVSLHVTASTPTIAWATPAAITYGTALTASQLDATATYNGSALAGTFVYSPAKGTVLTAGTQTLSVTFTPSNTADYAAPPITSVTLYVNPAAPKVTWAKPAAIVYGTALTATQLNATASVPGKFVYSPGSGAIPNVGTQSLSVTFTATDSTNYTTVGDTVTITVNQATSTSKITSNSPNPSTVGQSVTVAFSVTGSGVPTGIVTVTTSTGESCTGTLSGGVGRCALAFTASGSSKLTATYPGDINFKTSSSANVTQTVNP